MKNEREAVSVSGTPDGDGDCLFYQVGKQYYRFVDSAFALFGPVTRITVTRDLPGLHCDMERVRVFDGDTMIFEAPLHSLEGVAYAAPAKQEIL